MSLVIRRQRLLVLWAGYEVFHIDGRPEFLLGGTKVQRSLLNQDVPTRRSSTAHVQHDYDHWMTITISMKVLAIV